MTTCSWCSSRITAARRDARFCSKRCRQASHRAGVRHAELEATDQPLRLAYADPPYVGLSRKHYGDESSFAGEVDHAELLSRLASYDGWALSCSSRSVPAIAALLVAQDLAARLAIWRRGPAPHPFARVVTAWEGVWWSPARTARDPDATLPMIDVFDEIQRARPRTTLPDAVIGMKPPAFAVWIFQLLGATPGDSFDDLYPGSGIVDRTWRQWTRDPSFAPASSTFWRPRELAAAPHDE
jgi:hypothetical protein